MIDVAIRTCGRRLNMATNRSAQLRWPIIVYMRPSSFRREMATSMPRTSPLPPSAITKMIVWTPISALTSVSSRRTIAGNMAASVSLSVRVVVNVQFHCISRPRLTHHGASTTDATGRSNSDRSATPLAAQSSVIFNAKCRIFAKYLLRSFRSSPASPQLRGSKHRRATQMKSRERFLCCCKYADHAIDFCTGDAAVDFVSL